MSTHENTERKLEMVTVKKLAKWIEAKRIGEDYGAKWRRRKSVRTLMGRWLIYALLVLLTVVFTLPSAWMLSTALKPREETLIFPPTLLPSRISWETFETVITEFAFLRGAKNTLIVMVGVMAGRLLSASLAAYAFARLRWQGRDTLFLLVLSTMMISYHVRLVPEFMIFKTLGWLDSYKPLFVPAWLGGGAFFIFMLSQYFKTIPREYDDAGRIDGCSTLGVYWRIILPMSLPALGVMMIFTFMWTWNDFLRPLIYLNTPAKYTLGILIAAYRKQNIGVGFREVQWCDIMAANFLFILVPALVFFAAQRRFIQGVVVTGIKA